MDCIFCKIVKGELPSYKVYEDELFIGFLDIVPLSKGNVLLIPKKHYRWVNDVPEFGTYWEAARVISRKIEQKLGATSISYLTFGEEVPHAHIRIVPRYSAEDTYFTLNKPQVYSKEEMTTICNNINITT
ncbi:MAG: HIT domain-containing protein [Candidatus Roizmanbacteria bacterium]|nr:HIT domain-containing protein [Candidatus Roizmanbacteria bacterium]